MKERKEKEGIDEVKLLVDKYNLRNRTRQRDIVYKRFFLCHFIRSNNFVETLREIADIVGYKKHDNVIYAIKNHNNLRTDDVYNLINENLREDLYKIYKPRYTNNKELPLKDRVLACSSYKDLLKLQEALRSVN